MKELSLFTGVGGGVLGSKLLGWEAVGYVEWDKYCQEILSKRIEDGFLNKAPIFGDIDQFIKSGAAKKYAGYVDVVTAGFPCQPFSVAGKKRGQDDERNKWPQTLECIRLIRPRYALLENVPGLLNSGYFGEILSSLAQSGFDARWTVLGADDVGAPHRRKRLWILAYAVSPRLKQGDEAMAGGSPEQPDGGSIQPKEDVSHPNGPRLEGRLQDGELNPEGREIESNGRTPQCDLGWLGSGDFWWSTEPNVGRVANGVASRVDRLKALGNGQVPLVAATAWLLLKDL
jgi:DNA (cytosine-5)-methyltransferase 1